MQHQHTKRLSQIATTPPGTITRLLPGRIQPSLAVVDLPERISDGSALNWAPWGEPGEFRLRWGVRGENRLHNLARN